jgi:hypothetical protein
MVYASVVSCDSVQIAFLLAALNNLKALSADVQNAYLNAPNTKRYTQLLEKTGMGQSQAIWER